MNATFTIENIHYEAKRLDIASGIGVMTEKSNRLDVYPIMLIHENIIVPEAEPYSNFGAYLQMLTTNDFFAYCAGALTLIVIILSACRYIKQGKILFFQSLIDVLNLLINDNGYINYQRLSRAEAFLIGSLTFVGFIVVNGYLSDLQSYFTKPFLQPQLKTVTDIYNSPLTIAVSEDWADEVAEIVAHRSTHKDWTNKIRVIQRDKFSYQYWKFDTSTSYVMSAIDFDMMSRIQRRLNIRGFYDTGVTVLAYLLTFPVLDSFLFFDKLNEIIHWTYSSGLLYQWIRETFYQTEKIILTYNRKRLENQQQTVEVVQIDFSMIIIYGWIAGVIILIIEILWNKNFRPLQDFVETEDNVSFHIFNDSLKSSIKDATYQK
ncbi:uncharacterized protein LOC119084448 [Bradysia coprophila]|uniref:uncharacterized protein LOC119084448 n=1 Tax=Bradysia coprophila TaxID=38358 RepID=UPI00187D96CC|nr:uncharacterized protein LOC119084448 [Bradysia coprophila]